MKLSKLIELIERLNTVKVSKKPNFDFLRKRNLPGEEATGPFPIKGFEEIERRSKSKQ